MVTNSNYPRFYESGSVIYHVGSKRVKLFLEPECVFPPSETTLTLAEAISGLQAESALDIGTGSGLLAIVLAKSGCGRVWAIDKNPKAVEYAKRNAEANHVGMNVHCEVKDILSWKTNLKFDLIVSNPPFMPMPAGVKFISNEIKLAINGGLDGTKMLMAFGDRVASLLSVDGRFIFGLPQFVNHCKVVDHLSHVYSICTLKQMQIRYWLAEYDDKFVKHINNLVKKGCVDIIKKGKYLKTTLSILECRPPSRYC